MKIRSVACVGILILSISLSGCSSGKIPCPDVTGKKKFSFFGLAKKKSEPTAEDQANEGRDYGGRDMDFDKRGLVKKKKVKLASPKKKGTLLQRIGLK
ncbi:hypothetical protein [Rufibacter roseus]|uniref:Lipoprotein n=1 Tax=Rufibacter roseus TaxID=1567108 RepID=A0ABW2DGX5_9BACT|nr:hypothetical protein [Rufibacter roseus]